jgi:membrane-associated phospholipid phosphatase
MLSAETKRQAPVKFTLVLGAFSLALIAAGFFWLDQKIAIFFKTPAMEGFYAFCREIKNAGYSIHYFVAATIGFLASRYLYNKIHYLKSNPHINKALGEWSLFVIKSLILIGLAGQLLKILCGRQRPHTTVDFQNLNFSPLSLDSHFHSFPSGHTQVMLTVATIATLIWPKWRYFWFGIGIFLGFTRVVIHQHFFSDFAGGAFLGVAGTLWIYYFWPPKSEKSL